MTGPRLRQPAGPAHGPRAPRRDGARWPAAVAVALGVAGAVAVLVRPTAPEVGTVATEVDRFAPAVLDAIGSYQAPRLAARVATLAIGVAVPVAAVVTRQGRSLLRRLAGSGRRPVLRGALVGGTVAAATSLVGAPVAWWVGFRHERAWGLRTSGVGRWLADWGLATSLGVLAAAVAGAVLVAARRRWPGTWAWRLVAIGTALAAAVALVLPIVVEPLVLRTRPLEDGPIRDAVVDVLRQADAADLPVLVGDASRRTTRVNAYVAGLGPTRRLVLFDTLLELGPESVAAVVAHEFAHREHHDVARGVAATSAALLPLLALLRWLLARPAVRVRVDAAGGEVAVVAVALALGAVAQVVTAPVATALSRRAEASADARAIDLTGDPWTFARVARTFVVRDLADPEPSALVTAWFASHPSPGARVRSAAAAAGRAGLSAPPLAVLRAEEEAQRHPATREDDGGR